MTALIPATLPIDTDIPVPAPDPADRFRVAGPAPENAWSDADFRRAWGPDWAPNVTILRRGQSVLFPHLSLRGAPGTYHKIRGHLANKHIGFVTRQYPEGLRVWRVK